MQQLEDALESRDISQIDFLLQKLLHSLIGGKQQRSPDWLSTLQKEWNRRASSSTPLLLGKDQDDLPEWWSLELDAQIDLIHALCEWQLERPDRLRRLVSSDEDAVTWRVDPAGWDRQGNTYWLFDDNRLWIQRPPLRSQKRKAPAPKKIQRKVTKVVPPPRRGGRRSSRLTQDTNSETTESQAIRSEDVFNSESDLSNPPSEDEDQNTKQPTFLEFETVCVLLEDWQSLLRNLADSKHPDERSLYKYLAQEVYPRVEEVQLAEQRKQALEEAMQQRKRSSRIAMKESEREVREREIREARAARQQAANALAEERDRLAREHAEQHARRSREDRLRDREERILARERRFQERSRSHTPMQSSHNHHLHDGSDSTEQSDWRLNCEVCGKDQINPPNEDNVVACEQCGVWQHTDCWNRQDQAYGRMPRDWDTDDFVCSRCKNHVQSNEPEPSNKSPGLLATEPVGQHIPETKPTIHSATSFEPKQVSTQDILTTQLAGGGDFASRSLAEGDVHWKSPVVTNLSSHSSMASENDSHADGSLYPAGTTAPATPSRQFDSPASDTHGSPRAPTGYSPNYVPRPMASPGTFPLRRNTLPSPLSHGLHSDPQEK
ncbi:DNA-directed RNA polymerase [Malassezia psittaci]|uniref:DNA-directed RNA polymerase n=1 Tax=Malassezia psittaci TaxID=1821823 RepID=A0AAF0F5M7_9BASI|nr:DNA-directed RNA polymerase [Malassezia psittaci]